jgi:hypothetical protein
VEKVRYLLLIGGAETEPSPDDDLDPFHAWLDDLDRRGVLVLHAGLHASALATTVRVRDGETLLTDGPYAEVREQVGGLVLVDCADLDEAIEIAAGHPATAFGHVEIRPVRGIDAPEV